MALKKLFKPLLSGATLHSAGILMMGTLGAQLIAVLISPVLSRRYDPSAFGVFGIYLSITSIVLVVSTARYENAVLLPKSDRSALDLRKLSSNIALVIAVGAAAILVADAVLFDRAVVAALRLGQAIWLVPFTAALLGIHQSLAAWWLRREGYRRLAFARLLRSIGAGGAQLALSFGEFRTIGLILGQTVGHAFAVIALQKNAGRPSKHIRLRHRGLRQLALARRYSRFPKLELPQVILNSISQQLPIFGLMALFEASVTGFYVMASRVLIMPVALIGQSVRQVLLQRASVAKRSGLPMFPLAFSAAMLFLAIGIVPLLILTMFGPDLFAFLLGEPWAEAGSYAVIMGPWILMIFVKESVLGLIPALGLQGISLSFEIVGLIARTVGMFSAGWLGGPTYAIGVYATIGAVANAIFIVVVLVRSKLIDAKTLRGS